MKKMPTKKVYLEELEMEVKVRVATVSEVENKYGITEDSTLSVADYMVDKVFDAESGKQLFKTSKDLKDTLTDANVQLLFSTYTGVPLT